MDFKYFKSKIPEIYRNQISQAENTSFYHRNGEEGSNPLLRFLPKHK